MDETMPFSCLVSFHAVDEAAGWSGVAALVVALDLLRLLRPVDRSFLDAVSVNSDAARSSTYYTSSWQVFPRHRVRGLRRRQIFSVFYVQLTGPSSTPCPWTQTPADLPRILRPVDRSFLDAVSVDSDPARDDVLDTKPVVDDRIL